MKILLNKFIVSHRRNKKILSSLSFYMTATTKPPTAAAIVTAAIITLMQIIVSVDTAKTSSHLWPDKEITNTKTALPTAAWAKTFSSINPLIAQRVTAKTQETCMQSTYSTTATALKVSPILSLLHMSQPETRSAMATIESDCKSLTAAWGDIDPNIFYICDIQTKQPLQLRCPEGKGFFLGLGYSGCIPYEQWPACSLSSGHLEQVSVCDSEHMQQPWESTNPNKFYVCLKENIEPTIINCEPGKGFVHAIVTTGAAGGGSGSRDVDVVGAGAGAGATSKIVGCANWEKWRNYMHCKDYY